MHFGITMIGGHFKGINFRPSLNPSPLRGGTSAPQIPPFLGGYLGALLWVTYLSTIEKIFVEGFTWPMVGFGEYLVIRLRATGAAM